MALEPKLDPYRMSYEVHHIGAGTTDIEFTCENLPDGRVPEVGIMKIFPKVDFQAHIDYTEDGDRKYLTWDNDYTGQVGILKITMLGNYGARIIYQIALYNTISSSN